MAVRQRGASWQADITVKGVRHRETFDSEPLARAWVLQAQAAVLAGDPIPRPNAPADGTSAGAGPSRKGEQAASFRAIADRTHKRFWAGTSSDRKCIVNIEQCAAYLGDMPVDRIDTDTIDGFIEHCIAKGNSDATINRKLAILSKVLRFALDRGVIQKLPKIERKKEVAGRIRWLSAEEEEALLALLRQWGREDHADAITCLIDTGMRPNELYALAPRDLDLKEGTISIWENKTDHPRTIYMTKRVRAIMQARAGIATTPTTKLFPYDNPWMRNTWDRARLHLKLGHDENFVPYVCRHTCASRMIQKGVALPIVMRWLGHKSLTMTMRYAHLAPSNLRDAAAVLEGA